MRKIAVILTTSIEFVALFMNGKRAFWLVSNKWEFAYKIFSLILKKMPINLQFVGSLCTYMVKLIYYLEEAILVLNDVVSPW